MVHDPIADTPALYASNSATLDRGVHSPRVDSNDAPEPRNPSDILVCDLCGVSLSGESPAHVDLHLHFVGGASPSPVTQSLVRGKFKILPTGAGAVVDLPPDKLFHFFDDASVRQVLREKLAVLLYLTSNLATTREVTLGLALLAIQIVWITVVVRAVRQRKSIPRQALLLLAWPLFFAVPAIFFDVYIYYPRHIIAMYVAVASAAIFVELRHISICPNPPDAMASGKVDDGGDDFPVVDEAIDQRRTRRRRRRRTRPKLTNTQPEGINFQLPPGGQFSVAVDAHNKRYLRSSPGYLKTSQYAAQRKCAQRRSGK